MPRKMVYGDMINILAPINIFADTITLTIQFIIPCSNPTAQALFALASQLFITGLVALMVVFLLLYGFWDEDDITGMRHNFVVCQLIFIGIVMLSAFFVLGAALVVVGNHFVGGLGIGLIFVICLTSAIIGCTICCNTYVAVGGYGPRVVERHGVPADFSNAKVFFLMVLYVLEWILFVFMLGLGIRKAIDPDAEKQCNVNPSTSMPWPGTVPVSVINPETDIIVTFTDVDTILSFALTDQDAEVSTGSSTASTILSTTSCL
ncbi:hypothetical protein DER44DRAFT_797620, partial [Fusarium oxysporum]